MRPRDRTNLTAMHYKHLAALRLKKSTIAAIFLTTLSLLLIDTRNSSLAQDQSHPIYEVYALSYGIYPDFPVSALLTGADKTRKIDLQMMIWLVKGPGGKNILVDTGCYHENVVKGKGIKDLIKASDAIAKLLERPYPNDPQGRTHREVIHDKLAEMAKSGNKKAIRELRHWDRVFGPRSPMHHASD